MQERRRFPRVTYPCKIIVSTGREKEEFSLHTENISSGGVRIILQKEPEINQQVDLDIVIGKKHIKTRGRIVWVIDIKTPGEGKPDLFDVGIEFTQLTVGDREFLGKLIEQLISEGK
jgi:c-di-GMP-binding flagellar brake protein YcgR